MMTSLELLEAIAMEQGIQLSSRQRQKLARYASRFGLYSEPESSPQ